MAPGKDDVKHLLEGEISEEHSTSGGMLIVDIINGRFINNLQDSRRNIRSWKGFKRRHLQI
jgi:hypothetical protein